MKCLFCHHTEWSSSHLPSTYFKGKEFSYLRCENCSIIQISPIPNEEDLLKIYPPSYQSGFDPAKGHNPKKKMLGLRIPYSHQWSLMGLQQNSDHQQRTIVDFGCGNGHFIASTRKHLKCNIIGVEFNLEHIQILKTEDPEGEYYTIEEFFSSNWINKVDCVRMSNVWEHFTQPESFMKNIIATLKIGGKLIIEGPIETNPNLAYYVRKFGFKLKKLINPYWKAEHTPTHILFTHSRLQQAIFSDLGLKQEYWKVTEAEWPFPAKPKSLKQYPFWFIARVSMLISKLIPSWGNTFVYVGRK